MRLLLDTHVLLWWLDDDPRLGRRARNLLAAPDTDVLVSQVSVMTSDRKLPLYGIRCAPA